MAIGIMDLIQGEVEQMIFLQRRAPTADLPIALHGFTTTSLVDGSVLIAGGAQAITFDQVTAEALKRPSRSRPCSG
jgi:hypothetical protein